MRIHLIAPTKNGETYLFNRGLLPPLGLMYLAAHTPDGVDVRVIDESVERIDFTDVPDLVGITVLTATAPRGYDIADRYRASGARVVLGGVHPSMVPDEALLHADAVVIGEAEDIWPDVVSDAEAGRLKRVYRADNPPDFKRPLPPVRESLDHGRYWSANSVQTSRGCPHDCNFCSVTTYNGRRIRMRDVDNVLAEVETLRRGNVIRKKVVAFVDDNIAASPDRAKELFGALIPMKVLWGSQASITIANDEELLGLAAESGCHFLFIGLETLSAASLEEMGKRQNMIEEYAEALRRLRRHKIHVMGAFVFGFDADDETVFKDTLEFSVRNKIQVAQFAKLTPYPGTRLYRRLLDEGRVEPGFWLDPLWDGRVVFEPKRMSAGRLDENTRRLHEEFYSYRSILKRMYFHRHWSYWLAFNLLYRQTVMAARSSELDAGDPALGAA